MKHGVIVEGGRAKKLEWKENTLRTPGWPDQVARKWDAVVDGCVAMGVFQIAGSESFVLCYHEVGVHTATVEKFPSFAMAQERGNKVLSERNVISRG